MALNLFRLGVEGSRSINLSGNSFRSLEHADEVELMSLRNTETAERVEAIVTTSVAKA